MLGGQLGPYEIEAELGSGGMGTVYLARVVGRAPELAVGTRVAVKLIHPHLLEAPNSFKRFLLEGQLGKRVRHANVVRTYDVDAVRLAGKHHHFLVMEYVRGQTLRALLTELGTVPEELCRRVGRQIARGLTAIHAAGAVHRDLKPENVLLTPEHEVKIMDLGVARLLADPLRLSHTGHFVGSVLYAAPEAFRRGGSEVDGRADLHSLGVLLYEIATGRHPYRHHDVRVALRLVLTKEPTRAGELNPQLSPFLEEVIHKLCAKSAGERFVDAEELVAVLEAGEASSWWSTRARALAEETQRPLRRVSIPRETAIYGRDEELATLEGAYARACDGHGEVVLIDGEAGVGKSRLVDEFAARLRHEGADFNFLHGSYLPGGAATVTGAFSTAFREHFGTLALQETLEPYLHVTPVLVPAFAALLRGESPPPAHEPLTKDSLQTVFIHATHGLAEERPTVILIDDLHFAPDEGRALFAALALAVPEHRVLLLGAMRPGVPTAWAADVERHEHAQRVHLRRLGAKDLARLLEDAFRSERLAARLGHEIARKSDGNPFFVFEIVRSLREGGLIRKAADGSWMTTEAVTAIQVPSSVVDMVKARLAALDEADADLLQVAACCGYRFDPLVLAAVLDLNDMDVLRRLGRIERLHQLVRSSARTYAFDHHQVEEMLYAGLSELLRERYHGAIADVLAERASDGDTDDAGRGALSFDLCAHALKGCRPALARQYLASALDHLVNGYLHESAVQLADAALAAPGLLEGEQRCQVLLRKIERLHLIGRRDEELAAVEEFEALAAGTELEPRAHRARGEYHNVLSQYEESIPHLELAAATAREHGDAFEESGALARLGAAYSNLSRTRKAREYFETALALARKAGNRSAEATVNGSLGLSDVSLGAYDDARHHFERHLAISRELGSLHGESIATGNIGLVCADQGRPEEARTMFARKYEIARQIGDRMGEAVATANLGMTLHSLGRFDEARASYARCVVIAREIGARDGEANAAGNLGMIYYSLGQYARAVESYERSIAIAHDIGDALYESDTLSSLGTLQVALGLWDAARETLECSVSMARSIAALRSEGYALHGLALLADEQDDPESTDYLHAQAIARWTRMGAQEALADTRLAAGRVAVRRGEHAYAAECLDKALELSRATAVPGAILLAAVHRARLPDGDMQVALDALDAHEGHVGVAERMEARFVLYELTGLQEHLDGARLALEYLIEHAPAACRTPMRECVRLNRAILAASTRAASTRAADGAE